MKIFAAVFTTALALCSAINAQSTIDRIRVHFNEPVMVGVTKLPAGDCEVQIIHGTNPTIVFRTDSGVSAAAVASRLQEADQDAAANTSIVLNRRGNDLQLSRVLLPDRTGYQLISAE